MMHYILYKNEFVVLLNQLQVTIPVNERVIKSFPEGLINNLKALPQFDFDEDLIIVECKNEVNIDKIEFENIKSLIPLTTIAYLAYKRKFSQDLNFTNPGDLQLDSVYNTYKKERTINETRKSIQLFCKHILEKEIKNVVPDSFVVDIIKAKIDKYFNGKVDTEIKEGDYNNFFQSLFIYEDGSHLPRKHPIGFILHSFAAVQSHKATLKNKKELRTSSDLFRQVCEDKNKYDHLSLSGAYDELEKELEKEKENNKTDVFIKAFKYIEFDEQEWNKDIDVLKTSMYTIYFRYLINKKNISISDLVSFLKLKQILTRDMEIALIINVADIPFKEFSNSLKNKLNPEISEARKIGISDEQEKELERFLLDDQMDAVKNKRKDYDEWKDKMKSDGYTCGNPPKINHKEEEILIESYLNPYTNEDETWCRVKKKHGSKKDLFSGTSDDSSKNNDWNSGLSHMYERFKTQSLNKELNKENYKKISKKFKNELGAKFVPYDRYSDKVRSWIDEVYKNYKNEI